MNEKSIQTPKFAYKNGADGFKDVFEKGEISNYHQRDIVDVWAT